MIKFLAALFALIDKALGLYRDKQLEEQGRQKAQEELDANVTQAEAVERTIDPAYVKRLRDRFGIRKDGE